MRRGSTVAMEHPLTAKGKISCTENENCCIGFTKRLANYIGIHQSVYMNQNNLWTRGKIRKHLSAFVQTYLHTFLTYLTCITHIHSCIHTFMHAYIHTYIHTNKHTYIPCHTDINTYTHIPTHIHACIL